MPLAPIPPQPEPEPAKPEVPEKKKKKKKTKKRTEDPELQTTEQEEKKYYVKPHSDRQAHEVAIYQILAQSIEVYENVCEVLPNDEGLRFPFFSPRTPEDANDIAKSYEQLVSLLAKIHAAGVICSDLKPGHILENEYGELIIVDFDHAHHQGHGGGLTLGWCSAEQLLNQPCDFLDDLEAACKIAKYWSKLLPAPPPLAHQRDGLCLEVENLASLLVEDGHWLNHQMRFIASRKRGVGYTPQLYQDLMTSKIFSYPLKAFKQDFKARNRHMVLRTKMRNAVDAANINGDIIEKFVMAQLTKLFAAGDDLTQITSNQTFFDLDEKREVTEWDFAVCKVRNGSLPTPVNVLKDLYPNVPGGFNLIGEIWKDKKTMDNLVTKLHVLFEGHRPIHTLHFVGWLFMVSGGAVAGQDNKPIEMSGKVLLKHALNRHRVDLSVLLAAGRVAFFHIQGLPILVLVNQSADTIADLHAKQAVLEKKLADKAVELADKDAKLAEQDAKLADKDAKLADKDAKLADKDAKLADKDAELALLRAQLKAKNEQDS